METTNTNGGNGNGTGGSIMDRALALELTIGRLGVRRKVRADRIRVTAEGPAQQSIAELPDGEQIAQDQPEGEMLAVSKRILSCPEYHAIEAEDNRIRNQIVSLALPSMMRRGVYLVPDTLIDRIDADLQSYKATRETLIDAFLDVYDQEAQQARGALGALYDPADYPPAARVRAAFRVSVRWVALGVPGRMKGVSETIYHREQKRIREELSNAAEQIRDALRLAFQDLIDHMVDRLQPGPDGKPRIFRDSMVKNLAEFLETFSARNIAGDTELAGLVSQAAQILDGRDAESIRREPLTRQAVRDGMQPIKAQIDGMVTSRGRRFNFDKEAAPAA